MHVHVCGIVGSMTLSNGSSNGSRSGAAQNRKKLQQTTLDGDKSGTPDDNQFGDWSTKDDMDDSNIEGGDVSNSPSG